MKHRQAIRQGRTLQTKAWAGVLIAVALFVLGFSGCEPERVIIEAGPAGFAGRHLGYAWQGEARGAAREDANAFVEAMLELDEDANILDARFLYFEKHDGFWTTRQSGNAYVAVDFSVDPVPATLGPEGRPGVSMFTVYTASQMSLYTVAVDDAGTVALAVAEPLTRYRFEMKLPGDFDFNQPLRALTVGSGRIVPTVRTSGGAWLNPANWDELADKHLFDFHEYAHVFNDRGVFQGLDGSSSIRSLLERVGVSFENDRPGPLSPRYGYFGIGGWVGNYAAIADYLIGRNARDLPALVDWSAERYASSIDAQNRFGVDVVTGATRTAQNSADGISGATVRVSRESTAYQRALAAAGILSEKDVVIGRF